MITQYHDRTKHQFRRFAPSPGYLDWATQPDPFRSFEDAPTIDLVEPLLAARSAAGGSRGWTNLAFDELIEGCVPQPVAPGLGALSILLRFSLGLSAWKQAGSSRWALRVNPSSGNLHPTEGYVIAGPGLAADAAGVFHYAPDRHALERRATLSAEAWQPLARVLYPGAFLVGLTSIHWREAWKYGERAFRYCQHDVGHAIAAMRVAGAMVGWRLQLLPGWSSEAMSALMGLDREQDFEGSEPEEPACLMLVSLEGMAGPLPSESPEIVSPVRASTWTGHANRLSTGRVQWDWIDAAAEAARVEGNLDSRSGSRPGQVVRGNDEDAVRPGAIGGRHSETAPAEPGIQDTGRDQIASRLLLQRRSAVDMDGVSTISREPFLFMLRRTLPLGQPPFDVFWWTPRVHLVLFVHRVAGLDPGIYALVRSPGSLERLQGAFHQDFAWIRPEGVAEDFPLYLLSAMDVRQIARQLSCGQDIASDGFFSLGMIAEFDSSLEEYGAWFYRNLFWEAGAIGQVLYLEAEAAGCRGTGIGCFFDDPVHDVLGICDHRFQSLYHFTVGMPVDDVRLLTLPGYSWE